MAGKPERIVKKKKAKKEICAGCQEKRLPALKIGNLSICHECPKSTAGLERAIENAKSILPVVDDPESLTKEERVNIELEWEAHSQFVESLNRRLRVLRKKQELEDKKLMKKLGAAEKLRALEKEKD